MPCRPSRSAPCLPRRRAAPPPVPLTLEYEEQGIPNHPVRTRPECVSAEIWSCTCGSSTSNGLALSLSMFSADKPSPSVAAAERLPGRVSPAKQYNRSSASSHCSQCWMVLLLCGLPALVAGAGFLGPGPVPSASCCSRECWGVGHLCGPACSRSAACCGVAAAGAGALTVSSVAALAVAFVRTCRLVGHRSDWSFGTRTTFGCVIDGSALPALESLYKVCYF